METKKNSVPVPPVEDLVEVRKPTSLLVAQFFLFPLIIIAICVGIFLLFGYLTHEQKNPRDYLSDIRTGSETRRWQSAYELSTIVASQRDLLHGSDFVRELIAVYRTSREDDPRVGQFLASTLGQIGDPRAVAALLDGLYDPGALRDGVNDFQVESQIYTLWALGSIGDNAAVPGIVNQLRSESPTVRKVAAYVLGALKDASSVRDLQIALDDVNEAVRWNAAMALAQMQDASGADILVRLLDRGYIDQLEGMTVEQKNELMINAIKCLAILRLETAHGQMVTLSQNDPHLAVRNASLEALEKF